jgi:hypothetical protein
MAPLPYAKHGGQGLAARLVPGAPRKKMCAGLRVAQISRERVSPCPHRPAWQILMRLLFGLPPRALRPLPIRRGPK